AFALFRFKDFILTTSPAPPVDVGTSANATITIFGLNGFSGMVLFTDTVPNGLTCGAITPNNITANGNATLSCNSKTQSVYSVTIQATSGSLSHSTNISFAFGTPPYFEVSSTQPLRVEAGSNTTSTITVNLIHGFNGTVVLTEAAPSNLDCGPISPASVTGNSTATISCPPTAASTYPVTITGTSGNLVHTSTFFITAVDFYLSANPTSISMNINATGVAAITVGSLNGFGGIVTLDSFSPTDLMTTLSDNSVIGSGSLSLGVKSDTVGTYIVVISGTSGSLRRTATLTVHVGKHVPPILTVPSAETVKQLATIRFVVNATDQSIPSPATLTLSATNLPPGASFATIQGTVPVSGVFSWTPSTTTIPGTYTINFMVNFTATDSNNRSWTSTQTVMIHVENAGNTPGSTPNTQPPPEVSGSSCLTCGLKSMILAVAWFIFIGAVIGVISSVAFLTIRSRAKLLNKPMRLRSRLFRKTLRSADNPIRSGI